MIGTLEDFRTYHTDRGNGGPGEVNDADATAALVRGSDFVRMAFTLIVEETDDRVIDAAYVAAGYEISAGALLPPPGFWQGQSSGKTLTQAGNIQWTLNDAYSPEQDAMSPRNAVKAKLGTAAESVGGTKFLERA